MGRWEPNARGRLAQAAMTLYAEQGFDQTTTAQIATLAGLTERTFFRHYADKREVLFYGTDSLLDLVVQAIADAPPAATAMEAASAALHAAGTAIQETPDVARMRNAVVSANADLQERELVKFAEIAAAMAGALYDRGIPDPAARLAAEIAVAVFNVARSRWLSGPDQPDLTAILRESLEEMRRVVAGPQLAGSPALSRSSGAVSSRTPST